MPTRRTTPARPRRRRHNLLEFFETPPGFTRFLTRHVDIRGRIYCPTVGDGAIVRALQEGVGWHPSPPERTFVTNDLDAARPADFHLDARTPAAWLFGPLVRDASGVAQPSTPLGPRPDWVVDNPPFSVAYDLLVHAREAARVGVALHLRISFPEPTLLREELVVNAPPDAIFYLPRYPFDVSPTTGKRGTDSTTTAWMVWLSDVEREQMERQLWHYPFASDRRILVAPRSVAEEGWGGGQTSGEGVGLLVEAARGEEPPTA